jgi:hypothetical protein
MRGVARRCASAQAEQQPRDLVRFLKSRSIKPQRSRTRQKGASFHRRPQRGFARRPIFIKFKRAPKNYREVEEAEVWTMAPRQVL